MKKLSEKSRRLLRMVYRGLGVTAVSLVFQACYGMPPDLENDAVIHGSVRAKNTNKSIPGIKVSIENTGFTVQTSDKGYFYMYIPRQDYYTVKFEDVDGPENGGSFKQHKMEITAFKGERSVNVYLEEDNE